MGLEQYIDKAYAATTTLILIMRKAIDDEPFLVSMFEKIEEHIKMFKNKRTMPDRVMCRTIYKQIDMFIEQEKPSAISCRAGCAHCCSQFVAANRTEARHLLSVAKEKGIEIDRERLKKQTLMNDTNWHELPLVDQPCVFLDTTTKMCRVYEDRPLNCRKYFVVGDPKMCDINFNRTVLQPIWYQLDAELVSTAWMTVDGCESLATLLLEEEKNEIGTR